MKIESYAGYDIPGLVAQTRATATDYYYVLYNKGTSIEVAAKADDKGIRVASTDTLKAGDKLIIDISGKREYATISEIVSPAPKSPGINVILSAPLKYDHAGKPTASNMGMPSTDNGAIVSSLTNKAITLKGAGTPYILDAWTGKTTAVGQYTSGKGNVVFNIDLPGREVMLVRLGKSGRLGARHADSSNGGEVLTRDDGKLVHRAVSPGVYTVSLAKGKDKSINVSNIPAQVFLPDGWDLELESWRPDPVANLANPSISKKVEVDFSNIRLTKWENLPATNSQLIKMGVSDMIQVVGRGVYTRQFTLPSDWNSNVGAYLHMSHLEDIIVGVYVNDKKLDAVNQLTDKLDLGGYLKEGSNIIRIEIATLLANRVVKNKTTKEFGLTGVVLQPYFDTEL